jgi:hypothetical protein
VFLAAGTAGGILGNNTYRAASNPDGTPRKLLDVSLWSVTASTATAAVS